MDSTSTIFVQIACYRDPEFQWTVKDLFEKAAYPDRINVGVCWQFVPEEDAHCFLIETRPKQVRAIYVNAYESKGVCWARHITQKLWEGEEYTLQIDSHTRFVQDWDVKLFDELARCPSAKPIISNDPPDYTPPYHLRENPQVSIKRASFFKPNGEMRFIGVEFQKMPDKPLRGAFIMGCFIFASAQIIKEVPYDPYLYFGQEEATYSARLYTYGWDVFSQTQIILYHCYNPVTDSQKKELRRNLHTDDVPHWIDMEAKSLLRYDHLMGHQLSDDPEITAEIDTYGMGNVRSLEDYFEFCGINYRTRTLSPKAINCGFCEDFRIYHPYEVCYDPETGY